MDKREFLIELQRLGAICPKAGRFTDAAEDQSYIGELERKYIHLPGPIWKSVITRIIDGHKSNRLPMPHQFTEAVRATYGGMQSGSTICASCSGTGFVSRNFMHRITNEPLTAAVPCPNCRRNASAWPIKDDLIEVTTPTDGTFLERQTRGLTEHGAKYVLAEVEAGKLKMPESVMAVLIEKTCQAQASAPAEGSQP